MDPTLSVLLLPSDLATDPPSLLAPQTAASTTASEPNVGLIVGLTVGLTVLAVLVAVAAMLMARRSRAKKSLAMNRDLRGRDLERMNSSVKPAA